MESKPSDSCRTDLRIPLVIGVTGHRDLRPDDIPALEKVVERIFVDLRNEYPNTPWIVLSPLAEGADRLVTRVALRLFRDSDQLVVLMPMPSDEYTKDFGEEGSLADFDELAANHHVIETWKEQGLNVDHSPETLRDHRYAAAGAFIVRHSQVLIALWDQQISDSACGTYAMVKYRRNGLPAKFRPADAPFGMDEIGPVHLVLTPRERHPGGPAEAPKHYEILPANSWNNKGIEDPLWKDLVDRWAHDRKHSPLTDNQIFRHKILLAVEQFERGSEWFREIVETFHRKRQCLPSPESLGDVRYRAKLQNLDRFNQHASHKSLGPATLDENRNFLIGYKEEGAKNRTLLNGVTRYFLDRYALADALAIQFQKQQRKSLLILCSLVVVAGGLFHWYAHMARNPYLLVGYLLVLGLAFCLFIGAKRGNVQQQYLDYRALAEGMRIGFVWESVGLKDCVADHYLQQQHSELDWIRFALRNWQLASRCQPGQSPPGPVTAEHYEMVRKRWLHDQAKYHSKSTRRRSDHRKLFELVILVFFLVGIVLSICVGLRGFSHIHGKIDHMNDWLIVTIGFSTAIAAATAAYLEKTGISAESRHFGRMIDLFMQASMQMALLDRDKDRKNMDALLLAIGKEALDENALWVILHRERPLEVPVG